MLARPSLLLPLYLLNAACVGLDSPGRKASLHADDDCGTHGSCALGALQTLATRQDRGKRRTFRLLGAGLAKTGTSSLKVALERLGYRPVHGEFLDLNMLSPIWEPWLKEDDRQPALRTMLEMGYDSALDRPWCWAYADLLKAYPEMKVILTEYPKGGAAAWAASFETWSAPVRTLPPDLFMRTTNGTIGSQLSSDLYSRYLDCPVAYIPEQADGRMAPGVRERCQRGYESWYAAVQRDVPAPQLLVYNVTQGWAPLCRFLEVQDCPNQPFPRVEVVPMVLKEAARQFWRPPPPGEPPHLPWLGFKAAPPTGGA